MCQQHKPVPRVGLWNESSIDYFSLSHRRMTCGKLRSELRSETAAIRSETAELRSELHSETETIRSELRSETAEIRSELRSETAEIRSQLRSETAGLRSELRSETGELREEIAQLKVQIAALGAEMRLIKWLLAIGIPAVISLLAALLVIVLTRM